MRIGFGTDDGGEPSFFSFFIFSFVVVFNPHSRPHPKKNKTKKKKRRLPRRRHPRDAHLRHGPQHRPALRGLLGDVGGLQALARRRHLRHEVRSFIFLTFYRFFFFFFLLFFPRKKKLKTKLKKNSTLSFPLLLLPLRALKPKQVRNPRRGRRGPLLGARDRRARRGRGRRKEAPRRRRRAGRERQRQQRQRRHRAGGRGPGLRLAGAGRRVRGRRRHVHARRGREQPRECGVFLSFFFPPKALLLSHFRHFCTHYLSLSKTTKTTQNNTKNTTRCAARTRRPRS